MKFGLNAPNFGKTFGNPLLIVDLVKEAEAAGWDGFFLWDHILMLEGFPPTVDPFTVLAATAVHTTKILIGTAVTPLSRRRPWKLARECVTLDHLSKGRFVLGIGLGIPNELRVMNEEANPEILARMVNEQLEILNGLWSGEELIFEGDFYKTSGVKFLPKPIQQPRIKLWGAGTWPNKKPFKRAANLDGVIPIKADFEEPLSLNELEQIISYIKQQKKIPESYDFVRVYFSTGGDDQLELDMLEQYRDIGINWWIDTISDWSGNTEEIKKIIRKGPPKI
jgi:alkanesulfonate monooxygenase SsuD/methylene tetrahydromethanopterin reductase-like flavin-dependent oxidoreductase (luciferase family)